MFCDWLKSVFQELELSNGLGNSPDQKLPTGVRFTLVLRRPAFAETADLAQHFKILRLVLVIGGLAFSLSNV